MNRLLLLVLPLFALILLILLYPAPPVSEKTPDFKKSTKGKRFEFGEKTGGMAKPDGEWLSNRLAAPDGEIPENMRSKELAFARTLPSDANDMNALSWDHLGPPNVGGRTRGAAVDVTNEEVILAAGVSGGIWRTTDGGQSWNKMTDPDQFHSVTTLVQDTRPGHEHIWYYGTGEGLGNSASGGGAFYLGNGIYRSTDSGKSWQPIESTTTDLDIAFDQNFDVIYRLAVNTANDTQDVVYAACYGAVLKSVDGGENWEYVLGDPDNNSYTSDIAITSTGVVYATLSSDGNAAHRGIWRSDDGEQWTRIQHDSFPANYDRIVIGINPHNEDQAYFLARTPDYGKKTDVFFCETEWTSLWKYEYLSGDGSDSGGLWQNLSENIPADGSRFDNFNAQGGYNLEIAVSPIDSNVVFIGGTNTYRSDDAFQTKQNTTLIGGYEKGSTRKNWKLYEKHHPDQHRFLFLPGQPNALITANDGGMYKTNDAYAAEVQWERLNNSYITTQLYTVEMNKSQATPTIVGGFQDNGNFVTRSTDIQKPWIMPLNGDGSHNYITSDESYVYLSKQRGRVYKFELDAEGDSTGFTRIDPVGAHDPLFINPLAVDPNDEDVMYFPAGRVMWRNDQLNSLPLNGMDDSISTGWSYFQDTLTNRTITALAVSGNNPANRLYFGTDQARIYKIEGANEGNPAPQILDFEDEHGFPVGVNYSSYTSSIAVDPGDAGKMLIAYSNYRVYSLFYTEDGGESWEKAAGNLEQLSTGGGNGPSCRSVEILPVGSDTLFLVGTSTGLYATQHINGDSTKWKQIGANTIGNVVVEMVKAREVDGQVLVATHGNGIYRTYITSLDQVLGTRAIAKQVPVEFDIYPNPVSNLLQVKVGTNLTDMPRYTIFDESGKKVMNATQPAINVSALADGIYYLEVRTQNGRHTKSFVKQ